MIRVVYFGTSEESLPGFNALVSDERFEIAAVVTQPPKPVGRKGEISKSRLHEAAEARDIEVLAPEKAKDSEFIDDLVKYEADLFIVVSYGQILPEAVVDMPEHGTINIHPSLLPKWRGATPVPAAILAGDEVSGVTLMKMDAEMDHGPILAVSEAVEIRSKTSEVLLDELMTLGASMLPDVAFNLCSGKLEPTEQDHDAASFCYMFKKEDARIDWVMNDVEMIERMIRAYNPWPIAWTTADGKRLKILEAHIEELDGPLSEMRVVDGKLVIGSLVLDKVQFEGRQPIDGAEVAKTQKNKAWKVE